MKASCFLFALALAGSALGGDPPVKMAPYRVSEVMVNIQVVTRFAQNFTGQWVDSMRVGPVKAHSLAERAGLVRGMEIIAIQGQMVHGMRQEDLALVLQQPVEKEVVLLVRRSPADDPREVHIAPGK